MRVYLGLGTNLGDKESNLHVAVRKINERIGEVTALSAFYVTAPWGFSSENSFLNAACCVESVLPPLDILRETQEIERELGRMKKSAGGNYSDRLIDIDILLYGDLILHTPELEIPHPLMTIQIYLMCRLQLLLQSSYHPATPHPI
jgi:2-amino-4-hydroxy-6-hydroxymethyldihydropteridine diphosphokinase